MKNILLTPIVIFVFLTTVNSQNDPFAHQVSIRHVCGSQLGSVEFAINGNPDDYTYHWTHGPNSLHLDNLEAGHYTLVVKNQYGCVQTYEVEILSLESCVLSYSFRQTKDPCIDQLILVVTSGGLTLDESSLIVQWLDGNPAGLKRLINNTTTADYCVHIESVNNTTGDCCVIDECIHVAGSTVPCTSVIKKEVIVNEINRNAEGKDQFIELLVVGNGVCGDSFDLRNFIVDDNNGYLIPGNSFVNAINLGAIGINAGYLVFSNHSTWSHVPVGSMIVVYSDRQGTHPKVPAYDPNDGNQDGVYVVNIEDTHYFYAKNGTWNAVNHELTYDGYVIGNNWSLVELSEMADGVQVRYPDGSFCHGISLGKTIYSATNTFPLWLTDTSATSQNCRFTGTNCLDKTHFTFNIAEDSLQTPGKANSFENEAFIDTLRNCAANRPANKSQVNVAPIKQNNQSFTVFPNPFTYELWLNYHADKPGKISVNIFNITGQRFFHLDDESQKAENTIQLNLGNEIMPGIYIVELVFPDGHRENKSVVMLR